MKLNTLNLNHDLVETDEHLSRIPSLCDLPCKTESHQSQLGKSRQGLKSTRDRDQILWTSSGCESELSLAQTCHEDETSIKPSHIYNAKIGVRSQGPKQFYDCSGMSQSIKVRRWNKGIFFFGIFLFLW